MDSSSFLNKGYHRQSRFWIIVLILVIALLLLLYWVFRPSHPPRTKVAIPVVTALTQIKNVPVYLSAYGFGNSYRYYHS